MFHYDVEEGGKIEPQYNYLGCFDNPASTRYIGIEEEGLTWNTVPLKGYPSLGKISRKGIALYIRTGSWPKR